LSISYRLSGEIPSCRQSRSFPGPSGSRLDTRRESHLSHPAADALPGCRETTPSRFTPGSGHVEPDIHRGQHPEHRGKLRRLLAPLQVGEKMDTDTSQTGGNRLSYPLSLPLPTDNPTDIRHRDHAFSPHIFHVHETYRPPRFHSRPKRRRCGKGSGSSWDSIVSCTNAEGASRIERASETRCIQVDHQRPSRSARTISSAERPPSATCRSTSDQCAFISRIESLLIQKTYRTGSVPST
jgi:hypothetical protein